MLFSCEQKKSVPVLPFLITGRRVFDFTESFNFDSYKTDLPYSLFYFDGNVVSSSLEGCSNISIVDTSNKNMRNFYNINSEQLCQHTFLLYIISLAQYFSLHDLSLRASKIKDCEQDILHELDLNLKCFVKLRSKYFFEEVSMRSYYQESYKVIKDSLNIDDFVKEIKYSIEPTQIQAEKREEKKQSNYMLFFSLVTLVGTIFSMVGKSVEIDTTLAWTTSAIAVVTFFAFLAFSYTNVFESLCKKCRELFNKVINWFNSITNPNNKSKKKKSKPSLKCAICKISTNISVFFKCNKKS